MKKAIIFGICILVILTGCKDEPSPFDTSEISYPEEITSEDLEEINILAVSHNIPDGTCELNPIELEYGEQFSDYCPNQGSIAKIFEEYIIDEMYYVELDCDVPYNKTCIVTVTENRPKKERCYDDYYKIYHGITNETCYFFGCKSECEEDEIDRCLNIFNDDLDYCIWEYIDCVRVCLDRIEDGRTETYFAHEYNCLINESIEEIKERKCYTIYE